jgi:mannose-6-phosphate isomerase-like protein (cupin superfamily)
VNDSTAQPAVIEAGGGDALWFLGTFVRVKLDGERTDGRFGLFESLLPHGAAPPLHSHPQDESFYIVDGVVTVWLVESELAAVDEADPPRWVAERACRCSAGAAVYAPAGMTHTFRVE